MNRIIITTLLLSLSVGCASQGSTVPTLESSMRYRTATPGGANTQTYQQPTQPAYLAGMPSMPSYVMLPNTGGTMYTGTGSDPYVSGMTYAAWAARQQASVPQSAVVMMPGQGSSATQQMGAPTSNQNGSVIADGLSPSAVRTFIQPLVDDARRTRAMIRQH